MCIPVHQNSSRSSFPGQSLWHRLRQFPARFIALKCWKNGHHDIIDSGLSCIRLHWFEPETKFAYCRNPLLILWPLLAAVSAGALYARPSVSTDACVLTVPVSRRGSFQPISPSCASVSPPRTRNFCSHTASTGTRADLIDDRRPGDRAARPYPAGRKKTVPVAEPRVVRKRWNPLALWIIWCCRTGILEIYLNIAARPPASRRRKPPLYAFGRPIARVAARAGYCGDPAQSVRQRPIRVRVRRLAHYTARASPAQRCWRKIAFEPILAYFDLLEHPSS